MLRKHGFIPAAARAFLPSFELLVMASAARDSLAFRRVFFHGKEKSAN
jgi:hypothetical protein